MNTLDTMTKSQLTEIRNALLSIITDAPDKREGLCHNVDLLCHNSGYFGWDFCYVDFVTDMAIEWPKYSGYGGHPVPCPDGGDAWKLYDKYREAGLDLYSGDYGKLRLELAQFIIDKINETLGESA